MIIKIKLKNNSVTVEAITVIIERSNQSSPHVGHSLSIQVVKAGFDVSVVIVDLVLVESCLGVEGIQSLLELHQFCFPPLSIASLVANVLSFNTERRVMIILLLKGI